MIIFKTNKRMIMKVLLVLLTLILIGCDITGGAIKVKNGGIKIRTLPSNVSIYVDNIYIGNTPLTVKDLNPGTHLVNFSKLNKPIYSGYIKVKPGKTTSVHLKF